MVVLSYLRKKASLSSINFLALWRSQLGNRTPQSSSLCLPLMFLIKNSSVMGTPPLKPICGTLATSVDVTRQRYNMHENFKQYLLKHYTEGIIMGRESHSVPSISNRIACRGVRKARELSLLSHNVAKQLTLLIH